MKKVLILTAAVALTACQSGPAVESNNSLHNFVPETAEEKLNEDLIVEAVRTQNSGLCETIEVETQKNNCLIKVRDRELLESARLKAELKICNGIKEASTKKQCELVVEDVLADRETQENIQKEVESMQGFVDERNLKGCSKLEDQNFQDQCKVNIYMQMALESKDPSHCEKIDPKDLRDDCKSQF